MALNPDAYDYDLPPDLIAHFPLEKRSASKLLMYKAHSQSISHHSFSHLCEFLRPADVLVLNNTKVIKAKLEAKRVSGGQVSLLLLQPSETEGAWWALARPAKRLRAGEFLTVDGDLALEVLDKAQDGKLLVRALKEMDTFLDEKGIVPLPPYLNHSSNSANQLQDRYQSIFAEHKGAVAAPTASLHFDDLLRTHLQTKGIQLEYLTLHVGYGTFQPLQEEQILQKKLHQERIVLSEETAQKLNAYKKEGRRLVAVGTTVVRSLEACYQNNQFDASVQSTDLFIQPGYVFQAVDAMITNFHLPKSSLMMLVAAFIGREKLLQLYQEAIQSQYRFFSFGDAMLILPE